MPPLVASLVFACGIFALFWLDRDREARTSKALWIPVIWLWIAGSRSVSEWLAVMGWGPRLNPGNTYLDGSPTDRAVLAALLVLGLIVLIIRRKSLVPILQSNGVIVLFFLYGAASTLWSDYTDVAFRRWIKSLGDPVMVLVVLTDPNRVAAVKRLLARVGFLLLPLSVLVIKYYPEIGREYSKSWETMFSGVTTQKNSLGAISLFLGLASLWRFVQAYGNREDALRKRRLLAHGAMLAVTLWLFWRSNSMTALSCFLMAAALMVSTSFSTFFRKRSVVHLMVFGMVALSLFALFFDSSGGLVGALGRDPSLTGRTVVWQRVLREASNPLVGTGFESFWLGDRLERLQAWYMGLNEAHNGYLEVYLNLGWLGLTLLVLIVITGYRRAIRTLPDQALGMLWMAYFFACMLYNISEAAFRMTDFVWINFLLTAMALPTLTFGELHSKAVSTTRPTPVRVSLGPLAPSGTR